MFQVGDKIKVMPSPLIRKDFHGKCGRIKDVHISFGPVMYTVELHGHERLCALYETELSPGSEDTQ